MAAMMTLDDSALQQLYSWIDEIPSSSSQGGVPTPGLSRPKRNIGRDFADGVLVAEIVAHYFPRLVELHNYPAANSMQQKLYNWDTLNSRVFRKLGATVTRPEVEACCQSAPGAIEKLLHNLQLKMAQYRAKQANAASRRGTQGLSQRGASRRYDDDDDDESTAAGDHHHQQHHHLPHHHHHHHHEAYDARGVAPISAARGAPNPSLRHPPSRAMEHEVDAELLVEKEQEIHDLRETVDILEQKIAKLEQLLRLKDAKIIKLKEAATLR